MFGPRISQHPAHLGKLWLGGLSRCSQLRTCCSTTGPRSSTTPFSATCTHGSTSSFRWSSDSLMTLSFQVWGEGGIMWIRMVGSIFLFLEGGDANWKPLPSWKYGDSWTSLAVQWSGVCLPMQGTQVRSLAQEDPTCCRAAEPLCHSHWACTLEPLGCNCWSQCT